MTFETQVIPAAPEAHATPLLILLVPQGAEPVSLAALEKVSGGAIARCYAAGDFTGKKDETALLYVDGPRPRLLLVGVGVPGEGSRAAVRPMSGVATCGSGRSPRMP